MNHDSMAAEAQRTESLRELRPWLHDAEELQVPVLLVCALSWGAVLIQPSPLTVLLALFLTANVLICGRHLQRAARAADGREAGRDQAVLEHLDRFWGFLRALSLMTGIPVAVALCVVLGMMLRFGLR